jgi:hypothetical protein
MNNMTNIPFTYEHLEAHDEYIILHKGPIGYTLSKHDAEIITRWLNSAYPELIARSQPQSNDYMLSGGE